MDEIGINVLVEAKVEYTKQLISLLSPRIYSLLKELYNENCSEDKKYELKNFQLALSTIPTWSELQVRDITEKMLEKMKCEWIDELLTAVFVSNTRILTAVQMKKTNKKLKLEVPKFSFFIHKCFIECARELYKNPYLMLYDDKPEVIHQNMRETFNIIKESINETIRKLLPFKDILNKYLGNQEDNFDDTSSLISEPVVSKPTNKMMRKLLGDEIDEESVYSFTENEKDIDEDFPEYEQEQENEQNELIEDIPDNISENTLIEDELESTGELNRLNETMIMQNTFEEQLEEEQLKQSQVEEEQQPQVEEEQQPHVEEDNHLLEQTTQPVQTELVIEEEPQQLEQTTHPVQTDLVEEEHQIEQLNENVKNISLVSNSLTQENIENLGLNVQENEEDKNVKIIENYKLDDTEPVEEKQKTETELVEEQQNTETEPVEEKQNTETEPVEEQQNTETEPVEEQQNTETELVEELKEPNELLDEKQLDDLFEIDKFANRKMQSRSNVIIPVKRKVIKRKKLNYKNKFLTPERNSLSQKHLSFEDELQNNILFNDVTEDREQEL